MRTDAFMTMFRVLDRNPADLSVPATPLTEACDAWAAPAAFGDRRVAIKAWGLAFGQLVGRERPCDDAGHDRGPLDECLTCAFEALRAALDRLAGPRPAALSTAPYGDALVDAVLRDVAAELACEALWTVCDPYEGAYLSEMECLRQQREWDEWETPKPSRGRLPARPVRRTGPR